MNIYPNTQCANFCTWLIANSNIRLTPARKIQVQNVQTAANTGGYVTQLYFESFVAYTNRFYQQYVQYITQYPAAPMPTAYDAATTAWLANVSSPAQETIYAVDAFFKQLRADGNLLLDYFFLFAQDQQANARISLVNSGSFVVTEHNSPVWTTNLGYTGNGTNIYLSTNYTDSSSSVNYTLNSGMYGCYLRNVVGAGAKVNMGAYNGTTGTLLATNLTGGVIEGLINNNSSFSAGAVGTQGLFSVVRTGSTTTNIYKNGTSVATNAGAATALVNYADYIMCFSSSGGATDYDTNQYTCAFKGSGAINMVTFNSAVNLLMTNLGAHY